MAKEKDIVEKKTLSEKLNVFLTKYGKVFVIVVLIMIVSAIAIGVFNYVQNKKIQSGFAIFDEITFAFENARKDLSGEELKVKETELLTKALELADKNAKNGLGARAYMFAADIEFQAKNFENAVSNWIKAAQANKKSYTAALAYYNAAVASEELNDNEGAIKYFGLAVNNEDFALVNKALFNLGRVQEANNAFADAVVTYNKLCDASPDNSYAQLAKSRIIALQAEGKVE
ncbi:MAG: tetratricopeptide repeat protein [Treponema sp.]|nr:tetratricopeptide repeat protein [Treponema sp.]